MISMLLSHLILLGECLMNHSLDEAKKLAIADISRMCFTGFGVYMAIVAEIEPSM